jgi:hypothetical protein
MSKEQTFWVLKERKNGYLMPSEPPFATYTDDPARGIRFATAQDAKKFATKFPQAEYTTKQVVIGVGGRG